MIAMKIIPRSKMPKGDYCPAAECRFDFDQMAKYLGAKPIRGTFRDGSSFPNRYKDICLELSTGRYAILTQTEMRQAVIEICLENFDDEFFYEDDLNEVIAGLCIDADYIKRYQNDFTWIS
ncbi:MAG TPA: hypothetical protein VIE65_15415, partial [Methylobacter sp.]